MAGDYCRFCGRVLTDDSWSNIWSTHQGFCGQWTIHDRKVTGHDHATALNRTGPVPDGLHLHQVDESDTWRIIHTASGLHIPLIDWPVAGVPHRYATIAAANLGTSGVDWTQPSARLIASDLPRLYAAARTASTAAGDRVDDRPYPFTRAPIRSYFQHPARRPERSGCWRSRPAHDRPPFAREEIWPGRPAIALTSPEEA